MPTKNVTASGQVHNGPLILYAIIVNSHSSGAMKMHDDVNTDTFNPIGGTYTYASGSQILNFGPNGLAFKNGLNLVLTNAQDLTLVWQQGN